MCEILVFSSESSNPLSNKNAFTTGLIFVSRTSLLAPVMIKSSAYAQILTLSLWVETAVTAASRPLRVAFKSAGEMTEPYAKKVIMQSSA